MMDNNVEKLVKMEKAENLYRIIINDCPIAEGVGGVVGCVASLIT
jgi:hypothetical protein